MSNHRTIPINDKEYENTLRSFCKGKCKKNLTDMITAIPWMTKARMQWDIVARSISVNRKIVLERAWVYTSSFILDVD